MRDVVATGLGVIAPGASDVPAFWRLLIDGQAVSAPPTALPDGKIRVAEVTDGALMARLPVKAAAVDRSAQLAVLASGEALAMAGITPDNTDFTRVAVIMGNGGAGLNSLDEQFQRLYGESRARPHPMSVSKSMSSSSASWVSIAYGLKGPTFVIASACASGTHAIGIGAELIKSGMADVAVVGGAEAPLTRGTMVAWESMRILSPDVCRPFSKGRLGLLLGEGAGVVVLESDEHARARNAPVLARLAGFACSADAGDMFNPSEEGMALVMGASLKAGGLAPGDIDYINAHGTGTLANDRAETAAIKAVFGAAAPPISASKSVTGHGLGAAGGIEAVATILALQKGELPPTANYLEADPECDLDYVPNDARPARIRAALSNSFAFGGLNASLVFTK
jgi:nodulation protein E